MDWNQIAIPFGGFCLNIVIFDYVKCKKVFISDHQHSTKFEIFSTSSSCGLPQ